MILWYKRCSLAYRVSVVLFFVYEKEDEGSKCVVEALAAYGCKDTFVPYCFLRKYLQLHGEARQPAERAAIIGSVTFTLDNQLILILITLIKHHLSRFRVKKSDDILLVYFNKSTSTVI